MTQLKQLINTNISGSEELITPAEIGKLLPVTDTALTRILQYRETVENILRDKDPRLFIVVGPCSIHDVKAATEYAQKLKNLADRVQDKFFLIMRVYFEKPRTTVGWKGLINDPYLNDSFRIKDGLKIARKLLLQIAEIGLPAGTEALDPITPQYLAELITWAAIGARTTESQTHREMASGLSMPVGFKNGTDGSIQVAIDAMKSSVTSHHFLGINHSGQICKFSTRGNKLIHIVLRGGGGKSNYDAKSVAACEHLLEKEGLLKKIVIDCSHANSNKNHQFQPEVLAAGIKQIKDGRRSICGFMIESNLKSGSQKLGSDPSKLDYGVSITDGCVDWATTETMILDAYKGLRQILN